MTAILEQRLLQLDGESGEQDALGARDKGEKKEKKKQPKNRRHIIMDQIQICHPRKARQRVALDGCI